MNQNQIARWPSLGALSGWAAVLVALVLVTGTGWAAEAPNAGALLININTASVEELQFLPGVGASRASQIVDLRKTRGPFKSVDELGDVRGIGEVMLEKIRPQATVSGKTRLPTSPPTGRSK